MITTTLLCRHFLVNLIFLFLYRSSWWSKNLRNFRKESAGSTKQMCAIRNGLCFSPHDCKLVFIEYFCFYTISYHLPHHNVSIVVETRFRVSISTYAVSVPYDIDNIMNYFSLEFSFMDNIIRIGVEVVGNYQFWIRNNSILLFHSSHHRTAVYWQSQLRRFQCSSNCLSNDYYYLPTLTVCLPAKRSNSGTMYYIRRSQHCYYNITVMCFTLRF